MYNENGKFCVVALSLMFLCCYSFSQEEPQVVDLPSNAEPLKEAAFEASLPEPKPPESEQPEPPEQGVSSQAIETQPNIIETVPQALAIEAPPAIEAPATAETKKAATEPVYKNYEDYLDSLMVFAKAINPIKGKFESQKALINQETPKPKNEYEKQADYDKRIANFDKEKQKKIDAAEKEYKAEAKSKKNKLIDAVNYKDIQPNWDGMLKKDTTVEGYEARIAKFTSNIHYMKNKIAQTQENFINLDLLDKSDLSTLDKKNRIYLARLERGRELMQNYILQEQSKILSTERKNFNMAFGEYDPDKENFQVSLNDANSKTVPFDFTGYIKISPEEAMVIDRKTDDFSASVSYINYPFTMDGYKVYPGVTKADIYYKDKAVNGTGTFKVVQGFENLNGFSEWAGHADSLKSGQLTAKKLDSSYAMKKYLPKAESESTWWSRNKNVVRVTLFTLAAMGSGVGIWQNVMAGERADDVKEDRNRAYGAAGRGDENSYNTWAKAYKEDVKKVNMHEKVRNGFYIGAGAFGAAGIVSLCF